MRVGDILLKVSNVDLEITHGLIAHIILLVAIVILLIHAHATTAIHALAILPHHVVVLIESTTWSASHSLRHSSLVNVFGGSM